MKKKKIKEFVLRHKCLYALLRTYRIIRYYWFYILYLKYQRLFCRNHYKKLRDLKKSQSGRCFIIGTGPSMTVKDLELLQDEATFGVNSLCKVFRSGRNTTWYAFLDEAVWIENKDIISNLDLSKVFYNKNVLRKLGKKNFFIWKEAVCFYNFPCKHFLDYGVDLNTDFSACADEFVYDGYTIIYSVLQIAVFMGFTEIYLLGADCNYNTAEKMHFVESPNDSNLDSPTFKNNAGGRSMIECYKVAKKYADSHNIKIFNATRGGKLDVFERVNLEDVLKTKEVKHT